MTCVSGYLLAGAQCVNSNYYNLSMLLATNASTFFDSYQNLVNTLAQNIVGSVYPGITALFPTEMSSNGNTTAYSLLISSQCMPQTACSQNEYYRVSSLLNSAMIGNLTVIATQYASSFDTNNNSPNVCPPNCNLCNSITRICSSCASGFTLVSNNCLSQTCSILNCLSCSTNNVCSKCYPSFILTNNRCICQVGFDNVNGSCLCDPFSSGKLAVVHATSGAPSCILCKVQNCLNCVTSSSCISCASPYTLNSNAICVLCDIQDCVTCSSNNYCAQCSGILQPNAMGNLCLGACTVPNCLNCISLGVCATCLNGYELTSLSNTCVLCSVSNCINCISDNVCTAC